MSAEDDDDLGPMTPEQEAEVEQWEKGADTESKSNGSPGKAIRPQIVINARQMDDLIHETWYKLHIHNCPPELFRRDRDLVRVVESDTRARLDVMENDSVYGTLVRKFTWLRVAMKDGERTYKDALPPLDVVRDMLCNPSQQLPALESVVNTPIFSPDGSLIQVHGYHENARAWYQRPKVFESVIIDDKPSDSAVVEARNLIVNDLLGDFPFCADSDRTHAIAALLLPFVRRMIPGATPLHLIEAPTAGTGKSLLADLISLVTIGTRAPATMMADDEGELEKRLVALLMDSPTVVLLDNVRMGIQSAALSSAITSDPWKPRVLGKSQMVEVAVRCLWLATANNPSLSQEMARRCIRVRMDARSDRPWQRGGFRHEDIRDWTMHNRVRLVRALLTLAASWVAAGQKPRKKRLGSFEAHAAVVGGILEHCGLSGFLDDLEELYERADNESNDWRAFVNAWSEDLMLHGHVSVSQLNDLANRKRLLLDVRGFKGPASELSRLGKAMAKQSDRRYGKFTIKRVSDSDAGVSNYRLHTEDGV